MNKLENEVVPSGALEKSDYYLNKAIEALEEEKYIDLDNELSTYVNLAINNAVLDRLITLYNVKREFLELYRDAKL